jgi:hypothetical protein
MIRDSSRYAREGGIGRTLGQLIDEKMALVVQEKLRFI